ncbi:MAG: M15 family metallopeptidase, partial [Rhodanobacter sp.]
LGTYIASVSGHSRGATTDLTLLQCDARGGHCRPLDMGTHFDYFGVLAHTDAVAITPEQHANRLRLRAAMQREGFVNYPMEWWHYTLAPEPTPQTIYDVPIE